MLEGQYVVAEDEEEEVEVVQFSLRKLVPTRKSILLRGIRSSQRAPLNAKPCY